MTDETDQQLTDELYGGDKGVYTEALKQSHREALAWGDVAVAARIYPELEESARNIIKGLLGYMPKAAFTLPHEPAIRALLHAHHAGSLTFDALLTQAAEHVKLVRNHYIESNTCLSYDRELYRQYFDENLGQAQQAKERLTRFLGYEPKLEHSLAVELHLRRKMISDGYHFPARLITTDIQAITIIKYREVLLGHGKQAADASPLIAMELIGKLL